MRYSKILIILLAILDTERGIAQSNEWLVIYQEKVFANYNILGGEDAYKEYLNTFSSRVSMRRLDNFHLNIYFQVADSLRVSNLPSWSIMVKLNANKQLDSIFLSDGMSREQEIQTKLILSFIQYFDFNNLPIHNETKEEFLDGLYPVSYAFENQKLHDPDGNKFLIIHKNLRSPLSETGSMQKIIIDSSGGNYLFDRKTGRLRSLTIGIKKHQKIQGKIIALIRTKFQLRTIDGWNGKTDVSKHELTSRYTRVTKIYNPIDETIRNRIINEKLIGQQDLEGLRKKLDSVPHLTMEERNRLSAGFRAWIYLHPESVNEVRQLLGQYQVDQDEYDLLIDAIVNSNSMDAQHLLSELILEDSRKLKIMRYLLPKAAGTVNPGKELIKTLYHMKIHSTDTDISTLSGLSLSSLLYHMGSNNQALTDSITRGLLRYYHSHLNNDDEITQFLIEAGNSGKIIFADDVIHWVKSDHVPYRLEAIYALRLMDSPKVDSIISGLLLEKTDSALSTRIYQAVKLRYPTPGLRKAIWLYIQKNQQFNEQSCFNFLDYLNLYQDEIPGLRKEMRSMKLELPYGDVLRGMVDAYDQKFSLLN